MKDWIEKRIKEMKSDNVIPLNNWRDYYNRIDINIQSRNKLTDAFHKESKKKMGRSLDSSFTRGQD